MKDHHLVVKEAISKELSNFLYNYFLIKKQVAYTLFDTGHISPFETAFGTKGDGQVNDAYCHYADIAMETLLLKLQPIVEEKLNLKLVPTYSYARIYERGNELKRHKDRFSCEVSTTINLGGDEWPIFVEPSGKLNKPGIKINLNQGDMLIYEGCHVEHWREKFDKDHCVQVFLHYNKEGENENLYDGRKHIGLPL